MLEEFKMKEASIGKHSPLLDENYKSNIKNYDDNVAILLDKYKDISLYLVSAAPLLIKILKNLKK